MDYRVKPGDLEEDQVSSYLESQSARLPSSFYLGAALTSMVASLAFKAAGKEHLALFVGQWAAPLLIIGTYNKMVKQHGSDQRQQSARSVIHTAAS